MRTRDKVLSSMLRSGSFMSDEVYNKAPTTEPKGKDTKKLRIKYHASPRDRVLKTILFGDKKEPKCTSPKSKADASFPPKRNLPRRHSARDRVLTRIFFGDQNEKSQNHDHVVKRRESF